MTQSQPEFLQTFSKKEISAQLAIEETLITDNNTIQEVSTGLPFIVIPIIDLESIGKIQLDAINFKRFLIKNKIYKSNNINKLSTSLLFFTKQSYEADNDYNVRMFCLEDDILKEDSATGSANGCFLAYLLNYVEDKIDVSVEQGFQMNRKSYLYLEGQKSEDKYDIKVGGHSKIVAMGKWKIQA